MVEPTKVGLALAALRKKLGMTQDEVAARLGVTRQAVSKWERGIALPDAGLLVPLSELLSTSVESLLAGTVAESTDGFEKGPPDRPILDLDYLFGLVPCLSSELASSLVMQSIVPGEAEDYQVQALAPFVSSDAVEALARSLPTNHHSVNSR